MAVNVLFPLIQGWFVLANVASAYNTALDVFTVTFVAGLVVVPATVSLPALVSVVNSFSDIHVERLNEGIVGAVIQIARRIIPIAKLFLPAIGHATGFLALGRDQLAFIIVGVIDGIAQCAHHIRPLTCLIVAVGIRVEIRAATVGQRCAQQPRH